MPKLWKSLPLSLVLLAPSGAGAQGFKPPSVEAALAAVGSLEHLSPVERRLFTPDDDFPLLDTPGHGDWLDEHAETGQSYDDFITSDADRFIPARNVIYLQPIGDFPATSSPALGALAEYASVFFQMKVSLLPRVRIESGSIPHRINEYTHKPQILSSAVLIWLRDRVPADGNCLIAVTMTDLYPAESWNFVFGQASLRDRVGVFSFARSDPAFFGAPRPDDLAQVILQRSAKTLVHEITHTFGLEHCIYFRCVENGANSQDESDRAPHHLCPVCLRKLSHATGLDIGKRYRDLARFYAARGWNDEKQWVERQLAKAKFTEPVAEPPSPPTMESPKTPVTTPAPVPVPPPALPPISVPLLENGNEAGTPSVSPR